MNAIEAYILAMKHADKVALGIASMSVSGTTVTFVTTGGQTASVTLPTPADGLSVTAADLDANGHLIIHMSDGSTIDAGEVRTDIDSTLTVAGRASDAKAVGDRFAEFNGKYAKQTDINTLQTQITTNRSNISVNKSNIAQNKIDITDLKNDVDDLDADLQTEITSRKTADIGLQEQIDKLSAKTQILGATNCPDGQEQTVLTAYARSVTGEPGRPAEGDAVNIIEDGAGNARQEQWQWIVIRNATGTVTSQSWKKMTGPPTVTKATTNALGVSTFPLNGGLSIDSDGKVTTNKTLIGLGNVDNVRQYSKTNPAPVKVVLDSETFEGNTNTGVTVTTGAIKYDRAQNLTETQKARARVNIGIIDGDDSEQVTKNKNDIAEIKNEMITVDDRLEQNQAYAIQIEEEAIERDKDLQKQIDDLSADGDWIGEIAGVSDVNQLDQFVAQKRGRVRQKGDMVTDLVENAMWRFDGINWGIYQKFADGSVKDATKLVKGVVQIGDGIKVADGVISADKDSVGLDKVDNVKQYSESNPAPIKITLDGVEYEGNTSDGVTGETTSVKYTAQMLSVDDQTVARANIGALGVFASENERDTFKAQVETNKTDISTIKDEQVAQNTEIANLKKKSQWIGSIENPDDSEVTDARLNQAILEKVGTAPKEGYQLSVFGSDGNSTVYQYSETSNTWAISSKNADLQIASKDQLGLIQIGTGLAADEDGLTDVDTTVIATRAYVDAHSGGTKSQGDWAETDPTSPSYIKNKPFGEVPVANIETEHLEVKSGYNFASSGKNYYWIGAEFPSKEAFKSNVGSMHYSTSGDPEKDLSGGLSFLAAIDSNRDRYMVDIDDVSYYLAVVGSDEKDKEGNITLHKGVYVATTSKGRFINRIYAASTAKRLLSDDLLNAIYPIGSIYLTTNSANPAALFGGTWERYGAGRTIVGYTSGDTRFNAIEKAGGSYTHAHIYGAKYYEYYGSLGTSHEGYGGIWLKDYDGSNNSTWKSSTTAVSEEACWKRKGDAARQSTSLNHYDTTATTSYTSNITPYITTYMWKRTA